MEKLIYAFWAPEGATAEAHAHLVLEQAHERIGAQVQHLTVQVDDEAVQAGAGSRQTQMGPLPCAFATFWMPSAQVRAPVAEALIDLPGELAGYLVCESTPLTPPPPTAAGARTAGFCQVAMLRQPPRLSRDEWLHNWLDLHTQVAIDTQSTFGYRQNVVVRALTENAPQIDAIVEECFPIEALTDLAVFYDAEGDQALLETRINQMMESCARFIDFEEIGVLPTSEYRW